MACRRVRLQRAPLHRVRLFGSLQEHAATRTRTSEKTPTGLPALVRRGRGDLRVVFLLH